MKCFYSIILLLISIEFITAEAYVCNETDAENLRIVLFFYIINRDKTQHYVFTFKSLEKELHSKLKLINTQLFQ